MKIKPSSASDSCRFPASSQRRPLPHSPALSLALLAALALTLLAAPVSMAGAASKRHSKRATSTVVISRVTVRGQKVTVAGKVTPPPSASSLSPAKAAVLLTLKGSSGTESFATKPSPQWSFTATKSTKLTGRLTVTALLKIAGKPAGKRAKKSFKGPAAQGGAGKGGGDGAKGGSGGGGSTGTTSSGTPLDGTFDLEAGKQTVSGTTSGTYFRMMTGGPSTALPNGNSTFLDQTYTGLQPGTDGGLRTYAYQPPPNPAFAGGNTGDALANSIVQPQKFFNVAFSIVTTPTDQQTGEADPLPAIVNNGGTLGGQITAWTAAWNGQWFNQGSPKPNGTYAGRNGQTPQWNVSGTTPVTGTYNAATGHFVLTWQSLIVGGPFDGYTGQWHLEGTFVPST